MPRAIARLPFHQGPSLLQQLDSIHVTILHKEEGAGLGFSLAGGADLENKVITVSVRVMWHAGGRADSFRRG